MQDTTIVTSRPLTDNVTVRQMPLWRLLAVRVGRTYIQVLAGLALTFMVVPAQPIIPGAFTYVLGPIVNAFLIAMQYALIPAVMALLHNLYEYLTKLDQTAPEWRA